MSEVQATFSLVNLGCPKNTVDSEGLMATMALAGFAWTPEPMEADVCLVNTCGFLEASRAEAESVLRELAEARGEGEGPAIVATGCAVERAAGGRGPWRGLELADALVGFADYPRIAEICRGAVRARTAKGYGEGRRLPKGYMEWLGRPRMLVNAKSVYLKLGEGCSNCCNYCTIPLIRGRRVSRPEGEVVEEAAQLAAGGAREINLIAQDVTAYGMDRGEGKGGAFARLLRRILAALPAEGTRVRVLYAHPRHLTDEIVETMAGDARVCPYLDLPLQHVADGVLARMGRGYGETLTRRCVEGLKRRWKGMALRSTFIVGHPGEGEAEFARLLEFVEEGWIDHLGVFEWSPEPGTKSARMRTGRVPPEVAAERRERVMAVQAGVSRRLLKGRVGSEGWFFAEERLAGGGWAGRMDIQAPEVDGRTVVRDGGRGMRAGEWGRVRVAGVEGDYDLVAERVTRKRR